jgi:hypothetical protein
MNNTTSSLAHCFLRLPGSGDRVIFTRSKQLNPIKIFSLNTL